MLILFGNCTAGWGRGIKFWGFKFKEQWQCRVTCEAVLAMGSTWRGTNSSCIWGTCRAPGAVSQLSLSTLVVLSKCQPLFQTSALALRVGRAWLSTPSLGGCSWRGQQDLWGAACPPLTSWETAPFGLFFQNRRGVAVAWASSVCSLKYPLL